jgi:hypothetical protein
MSIRKVNDGEGQFSFEVDRKLGVFNYKIKSFLQILTGINESKRPWRCCFSKLYEDTKRPFSAINGCISS